MSDQFSRLPVELIHKILDDVSTFDILTYVCLVNKRLRTVSLAYPRFQLDLTHSFIRKREFDKLCTQLVYLSSQIVSLTLNNEADATIPTKISYLFSRSITVNSTFSSLHSLSLSHIDFCIWDSLKARLTSFIALTSISINFITDDDALAPLLASIILMELLFFSSSLKRLSLNSYNYPSDIITIDPSRILTASSIEYLNLDNFGIDLKSLFAVTPALVALTSTFEYSTMIKNIDQQPSVKLQRLSIIYDRVTLDKIERLLSSMTHLIHFTLVADYVRKDMADGDRWAQLLSTITTFKFKFAFCRNAFIKKPLDLHSFHTSFWLVEKKWYVTHDWCIDTRHSLLYSNPYCLDWYPFDDMIGTFVTESTSPELTSSLLHVIHLDVPQHLLVNNTLLRRCTHVSSLSVSTKNLNESRSWRYATTYLDLIKITHLAIDTIDIEMSSELTVQLVYGLPSLRSFQVSVTILKWLLVHNWPHIVDLFIVWGSDRSPKLLTQNEVDSLCRSFTHVEELKFSRCFIDNISQVLNSMMMTLLRVSINYFYSIALDDDRFISYEWLERNTKLRNFDYWCDDSKTVHIWL